MGQRSRNVSPKGRGLGYRKDLRDFRDHEYLAPQDVLNKLPSKVDLRDSGFMPEVYDQGNLGSCVGNAIASALKFDELKQGEQGIDRSRLFIYREARAIEGSVNSDSGCEIRDGIKVVADKGAPPEASFPYDISKFTDEPSQQVYDEASKFKAVQYQRVTRTLSQMKGCIAAGYGFVFGATLYNTFESRAVETTGKVPMPKAGDQVIGGHALHGIGYNDYSNYFTVKNSWGDSFGDHGYVYFPYLYMVNRLVSDLWRITTVS